MMAVAAPRDTVAAVNAETLLRELPSAAELTWATPVAEIVAGVHHGAVPVYVDGEHVATISHWPGPGPDLRIVADPDYWFAAEGDSWEEMTASAVLRVARSGHEDDTWWPAWTTATVCGLLETWSAAHGRGDITWVYDPAPVAVATTGGTVGFSGAAVDTLNAMGEHDGGRLLDRLLTLGDTARER